MGYISPGILSGSTNGTPIDVAATASPGTAIQTAHATSIDRLGLWAFSTTTTRKLLTVQLGGTASKDSTRVWIPPRQGLVKVCAGIQLTNSLVVRAFCNTANVVSVVGLRMRTVGTSKTQAWTKLSGSTDGASIDISGTTSGGANTLHTATADAGAIDFVTLFAVNYDEADRGLAIELGGTTTKDTLLMTVAAGKGPMTICEGLPFDGGVVIKGYAAAADNGTAATASKVSVYGFVDRRSA